MKCLICDKKATGRYTTHLIINGLPFCEKHKDIVCSAMFAFIFLGESQYKKFINDYRRNTKTIAKKRK